MRFHALALPHTITRRDYSACAFTQKVLKFCKMMTRRGHTVFHYGHEKSEVECTEHITVTDDSVLEKAYGTYDWHVQQFKHSVEDFAHTTFNIRAAEEITKRKQPGDFLLLFWGHGHGHVAKVHANDMILVEPGIGSFNKPMAPFCVFESYAVMHHNYGKHEMSPRFMDSVVPNYFDLDDFIDSSKPLNLDLYGDEWGLSVKKHRPQMAKILDLKPGYVLVIARLIPSKGIQIAVEACKALNLRLVLAGQGSLKDCIDLEAHGSFINEDPLATSGLWHIGYVEPAERSVLLAKAKCLMCPTQYLEPFGGVNVEAQMSGVPVVSTDWGAFAETVVHGVSGYRCRTMDHFIWALKNVSSLNKALIRSNACANYGFTKVGSMYEEYFSMLQNVFLGSGFYAKNEGRLALKWLEKKM